MSSSPAGGARVETLAGAPPRRRWLAVLLLLPLLAALLLLALVALALQSAPQVPRGAAATLADVGLLRQLLVLHDPGRARASGQRTLVLNPESAERLGDHALRHLARGAFSLRSGAGRVDLALSLPAPGGLPGWVNVSLRLRQTSAVPAIEQLRIGHLPLPGLLGNLLLEHWGGGLLQSAAFSTTQMQFRYEWNARSTRKLLAVWLPAEDRERLRRYGERIAEVAAASPQDAALPLADLLQPLFALARERAGDARREHRALLLALAGYVSGRDVSALVFEPQRASRAVRRRVTLAGRDDFAMHFAISAALASEAGGPLADAIGLYKEVSDSRWGSGFSFNDIAVDRAGARFGTLAVGQPQRLQSALAAGVAERDLLPDVSDLPEFLSAAQFSARYGGVGAPAYSQLLRDIDARVAATRLLN